ncbi:SIMPL domain-containing protein [Porcincola sp. LCP21S3_C12]|uniref:SIMPL domain-containing protein n=1 Tax=Porcincola sp. LCP21S3_C12 TaxID=3438798 RepID=UPI003F98251E
MKKLMRAAAAALGLAGMVLAGAGLAAASESQPNSEVHVAEETGSSESSAVQQEQLPEKTGGKSRTVSASATGVVMEVPDMAQITFGIVTNGEKADAAQSENTEKVNQVIETLKGMGVDEKSIQTSGYSISPQYDYDNLDADKQPKLTGYEVRTTLQVSDQKIADAGKILSESVKSGVNDVEGVVYTCSTYDEKYEEALQEAVKAARKKADVLAKAEGASAGKAVSISEGYQDLSARYQSSDIGAVYKETAAAAQDASSIPDLSAGTLQIKAEVSVTYELAY